MNINFRNETFRNDFTFRNSPESIRRFPFPFHEDKYMYAVNMEPHVPAGPPGHAYNNPIDVDEHYVSEMRDRALVLKEDPLRYQALPHMMTAQWDTLELLMEHQAAAYPDHFTLTKDGDRWHWINRPLGIDQIFTFGDASTLPMEPLAASSPLRLSQLPVSVSVSHKCVAATAARSHVRCSSSRLRRCAPPPARGCACACCCQPTAAGRPVYLPPPAPRLQVLHVWRADRRLLGGPGTGVVCAPPAAPAVPVPPLAPAALLCAAGHHCVPGERRLVVERAAHV